MIFSYFINWNFKFFFLGLRLCFYTRRQCIGKVYISFVHTFVTHRTKHRRPIKIYTVMIRTTREIDLAMSVCPSVRGQKLERTGWDTFTKFGTQILWKNFRSKFELGFDAIHISGTSSTPIWSKLRVLWQFTHKYVHNSNKFGN